MALADAVVDWAALLEVVWVSLVSGIGVTAVFAIAILGGARALDLRRDGHAFAAGAYSVLMVLAFAFVLVAVALGIVVMTQK